MDLLMTEWVVADRVDLKTNPIDYDPKLRLHNPVFRHQLPHPPIVQITAVGYQMISTRTRPIEAKGTIRQRNAIARLLLASRE
jgi:hypothetical protein